MFTIQGLDHSVPIESRDRLIEYNAVINPFNKILVIANRNDSPSGEHFIVDANRILVQAGHMDFARKDGAGDESGNFKSRSCSNDTHKPTINTRSAC